MGIEFSKVIRRIREERGWTLEEMANVLGTTKQALSLYERGERTPKITVAARFAEILGMPLTELVGVPDDEPDSNDGGFQMLTNAGVKSASIPKTSEARILARGIDKLPKSQREQALTVVRAMFAKYADYFEEEKTDDT